MSQSQTSEDVVWIPDYNDIDPVEVEEDLRREEERRHPKKFRQERFTEIQRKTEDVKIAIEQYDIEQKIEKQNDEAQIIDEPQELRFAEQKATAGEQQSAQRLKEVRQAELEQAKAEVEKAKAEAQRIIMIAQQSVRHFSQGTITKNEAQNAIAVSNPTQPSSLENPPPNPGITAQAPPWGKGFGPFLDTKSPNSEPILSPLFFSANNSSPTSEGGATPLSSNPVIVKVPVKKKPLLGAAFGGDNSVAS